MNIVLYAEIISFHMCDVCVCVFVSAGFGYMAFLRCIKGCCEEIYHNKCWCLCLRVVTCSGENSQETELKRTKRAKLSYLIKLS